MRLVFRSLTILLTVLSVTAGCEKLGLVRVQLPDMGPPLPVSATIAFDRSVTSATYTYTDACGHPNRIVALGKFLESAITDAADQTFKKTDFVETLPAEPTTDLTIQIVLQQQGFKLLQDNIYDRVPAELFLETLAVFRDASGKVLREVPLKVTHKDRVLVLPDQRRCDYVMDPFVQDAAVKLATLFVQAARDLSGSGQAEAPGQPGAPTAPSALAFKTVLLDENGNQVLEGGERVTIRVDLTNTGAAPITGVAVKLGGSPAFLGHFSSPTLSVDALQPGETRPVEFVATLPLSLETQQVEVTVSVQASAGASAPAPQTLTASLRGGGRFDSVDQIPSSSNLQHPHTYVLSVGISTYRDPQIAARRYAALDAELVAAYFQTLGGVPLANIRLLQDWKAVRSDIEEFILEWLPKRLTGESVVIVYFSGQAAVLPNGEIYLVPYDGTHNSTARLYPLKDLEAGLARLKSKQTVFIFDGGVVAMGQTAKRKGPVWSASKSPVLHLIATTGLRDGLEPTKLHHGLFTYYLLRGLRGDADRNGDGEVTLGELTAYLERAVPEAARQDFGQEQRPLIVPPLPPTSKSASVLLTKSAGK